jgi:hypothetical protein
LRLWCLVHALALVAVTARASAATRAANATRGLRRDMISRTSSVLDGRGYRLLIANRALSFSAAPVGDAVDDAVARAPSPLSLGTINPGKRGTYGKSGKCSPRSVPGTIDAGKQDLTATAGASGGLGIRASLDATLLGLLLLLVPRTT